MAKSIPRNAQRDATIDLGTYSYIGADDDLEIAEGVVHEVFEFL